MNELISQITEKVGISSEQAQQTIGMVTDFIKDKLPTNMQGMLDSLIGGGEGEGDDENAGGGIADMAKNALGGIFGNKE